MKLTIQKRRVRGKVRWAVYHWQAGKPKRTFFNSKAAADAEAERLRLEIRQTGEAWLQLSAQDRERLMLAYADAQKEGLDLHALIARAKQRPQNGNGHGPALDVVIEELIGVKEKAGRSEAYTANLKHVLTDFANGRGQIAIGRVSLADVESFLDTKSLASRSTLRARLSTMFKFAIRREYRPDNPCARLEPVTVTKSPPAIFTVKQIGECLQFLCDHYSRALPWFVLSTFCGLRPEEADKTTQADIHVSEGWIKIEAQTTKVRQRRLHIHLNRPWRFFLGRYSAASYRCHVLPVAGPSALSGGIWRLNRGRRT